MDSFKQKIPLRSKSKLIHMALIPFFVVDYFNINNTRAEKKKEETGDNNVSYGLS